MPSLREAQLRQIGYYSQIANIATQNQTLSLLDLDYTQIRASVEFCLQIQDWQYLLSFFKGLEQYWLNTADWDILNQCVSELLKEDLENDIDRADVLNKLAEAEETLGRLSEARRLLESKSRF